MRMVAFFGSPPLPFLAAGLAGLFGGCQPHNNTAYTPQGPPPGWTAPPPTAAPPPMPVPSATASLPPTTQGPSATPLDASTLGGAVALALAADAAVDAPKMGQEGALVAGTFQEGQVLEQPITIMPGRCYTFIAASAGGAGPQELAIQLVAQSLIPGIVPMMGEQKGAAGKVVLGKGAACVKLALIPIGVPSKWVIKATRGSGIVVGQAFSR
jgi:hypothetical protein